MYLLVLFFPLLSSFCLGFFGFLLGKKGSSIFALISIFLTFLISLYLLFEVMFLGSPVLIPLSFWFSSGVLLVKWSFYFDSLTTLMLLIISIVSFLVHLYSLDYMGEDPHLIRFISYLSFFTFCMVILVTANNYIQMFVGWEGVGLASYLLISFWNTRIQALKSALKAMILNRFGDFGLLFGFFLIYFYFGTFDYLVIFSIVDEIYNKTVIIFNYEFNIITLIGFFLFIGAVGKSAQLGLHTWLPDAMEGPTPVSALIHAATMVTAGVFVILRSSPLLEYSSTILVIIMFVGSITAIFSATVAIFQNDLKKIIAYSTCSQLGYMVFSCGLSNYSVSMFHLVNHAYFKALLFLSSGVIIHAMMDEQDLRRLGGLGRILPFTYLMIFIGSIALLGFPFLTGFYSKDMLLELSFVSIYVQATYIYLIGVITALLTAFYSFKLLYLAFVVKPNAYRTVFIKAHEGSIILLLPLGILAIFSIYIGYLFKDLVMGSGTDSFGISFLPHYNHIHILESEYLNWSSKNIPLFFTILGLLLSYFILNFNFTFIEYNNNLNKLNYLFKDYYYRILIFFSNKWFFDFIYNKLIALFCLNLGYKILFKKIDRGIIEFFGPIGIIYIFKKYIYKSIGSLQSGYVYHYGYLMILGIIILIWFIYLI